MKRIVVLLPLILLFSGCNSADNSSTSTVGLAESPTVILENNKEEDASETATETEASTEVSIETTDAVDEYSKANAAISGTMPSLESMQENNYADAELYILAYTDIPDGQFTKFRAYVKNKGSRDSSWVGPGMILVHNEDLDDYHKQCFYVDKDVLYKDNESAIFNAIGYGNGILNDTDFVWADGTPVKVQYADSTIRNELRDKLNICSLVGGSLGLCPIVKMFKYDKDIWEEQKELGYIDIYLNIRKLGMDEIFAYGDEVDVLDKEGNSMLDTGELIYMGEVTFRINKYLSYSDALSVLDKIDKVTWTIEDGTQFEESVLTMQEYEAQKG